MDDSIHVRLRAVLESSWIRLLPILTLAGLLRFDGLSNRGLLYWDEGKFALEGIRLLSLIQALPHLGPDGLAGKAVGTAKPSHALLIALSYAILGVHDYAPLMLDAAASVLQVGVLFLLGRELFGTRVGLVAALILAVSGYDIIYARSALSESDADLCFLIGVLLWWRVRTRSDAAVRPITCLWPGVVLGLAFTINYRLIVYIAPLVCMHAIMRTRRPPGETVLSLLGLVTGLVMVPVLWEAIGLVAQAHGEVLFRSEISYRPTTYFGETLYQLHGGKQSVIRFSPLPYLEWFVVRQGWPLTILLLVGVVQAAIRRSARWMVPLVLILVPYGVYTFAPFTVPRNLDAALPFAALLSAAALIQLVQEVCYPRIGRSALWGAVALLALFQGIRAWPLTQVRSGFAMAAGYVQRERIEGAMVLNEVLTFYLRDPGRGCDAPRLPNSVGALGTRQGTADEYAIVDSYYLPSALYLARHAHRVASYPAVGAAPGGEDLIASENGIPPSDAGAFHVDVYSLDGLHLHLRGATRLECTLDRLA